MGLFVYFSYVVIDRVLKFESKESLPHSNSKLELNDRNISFVTCIIYL